jgi:hypothetical protein
MAILYGLGFGGIWKNKVISLFVLFAVSLFFKNIFEI